MPDETVNGKLVVTDKIGIGIEEPIAQLHIASSTAVPSQAFLESGGTLLKLSVDASGAAIGTDNAFPLNIQTDSSSRISINNAGNVTISGALSVQNTLTVSGNVGIGTPSPDYTLDVNGILNVTQIYKNGVPWSLTTSEIADNAITATKIQDGSVGQAELSNGAVTELKIANNAVTEAKLANDAVTALKIADSSIGTAKLADGVVNGLKIAIGAVGTDKLADGAVTASKITNLSVGTTKLADGAVTPEKLAVSVLDGVVKKAGDTMTGALTINKALTVSGNVGIGTTAPPTTELEVVGTVKATSFQGDGSTLDGVVKKAGDTMTGALTINKALTVNGNVGIGTTAPPTTELEVVGTVKATSFQGDGANLDGIVRKAGDTITGVLTIHNNLTVTSNVGIGITTTPQARLQVADGAIMPSTGNTETAGIMFPKAPAGGSGDAAWIRYYLRTGEATTFEIGTSNDNDAHIALMASGNVGIGTISPGTKLEVKGHLTLDADDNPILYTGTGNSELNRYLQLINSPNTSSASGLKAGGILVSDSYAYANPSKNDLIVKGNVGIGTANPEAKLHVVGDLLGAAKDELGNALRICCGKTPEGKTNWQVYRDDGVFVEVDTSLCGFRATPLYFVNMHGNGYNWETTGGSSAYNRTATSFRVYVKFSDYRKFTPEFANSQGWHIQWLAIGN